MAQAQSAAMASQGIRPTTPEKRAPIGVPKLSPSRIPGPLVTNVPASFRSGHFNLDTFSPVNQNGSFEFDRVIKSGKVLRRVKKKGAWKPSWKDSHLVLRPNLLSVYKDPDETELRASITLSDVTAVARVKKTNTDNVFGVFTPAKNYHFSGMTELDTSDWVTLLRLESRLADEDDLDLAPPNLHSSGRGEHPGSESTDLSAEDEVEPSGSPEGPQSSLRGNKSRGTSVTNRKPSGLRDYSANEAFTTSQSDLSDGIPVTAPTGQHSSSLYNRNKPQLAPIPDGASLPISRPSFQRSTSQLSVNQMLAAQQQQQQQAPPDPVKVIRQANLQLLKSVPGTGVRQWKTVWTVLRNSHLAMYKSTDEYEPIKIMQISDIVDAAEIDPVSKSKKHCFQIIGLEKTLRLCADSEAELDGWLGALKSALHNRKQRDRGMSASKVQGSSQSSAQFNGPPTQLYNHSAQNMTGLHSGPGTSASVQGGLHHSTMPGIQIQRPTSALDGIVEGTEDLHIR